MAYKNNTLPLDFWNGFILNLGMLNYFDAYEKQEEKETAVTFPAAYGFWIRHIDEEIKNIVWLDHRLVPLSLLKERKDGDIVWITITLGTTVLQFPMKGLDWREHIYAARDNAERIEPAIIRAKNYKVQSVEKIPFKERKFNFYGLAKSRREFIEVMNKKFKEGLTNEQAAIQYPDWKKAYYPHVYK